MVHEYLVDLCGHDVFDVVLNERHERGHQRRSGH